MNYAVILAGGSGVRFWPLSRRRLPKQFLRVIGRQSLMQATLRRTRKIVPDNNIFIATNKIYLEEIRRQIKDFGIPKENIILEPEGRNTLPAVAVCAQIIIRKDPQANLLISPSDHYIGGEPEFKQVILKALKESQEGFLCLIGVRPDRAHSGYGYIKIGRKKGRDSFYVDSFREKPESKTAKRLFKQGNIFWNSGIFCFKAETILNEIKNYVPSLYAQMTKIKEKQDISKVWPKIKPVSIDYGILEKSKKMIMVWARFRWCDLGSWDALEKLLPKDKKNNVILSDCDCVSLNTANTLVCSYGHKRLIGAVGLRDLIIVDTPDALLVCRKDKAQDIKRLVDILKKKSKTCV